MGSSALGMDKNIIPPLLNHEVAYQFRFVVVVDYDDDDDEKPQSIGKVSGLRTGTSNSIG